VTGHNPRVLISEKEHSGSTWPPGRNAGEQEQTALRAALATLNAGASRRTTTRRPTGPPTGITPMLRSISLPSWSPGWRAATLSDTTFCGHECSGPQPGGATMRISARPMPAIDTRPVRSARQVLRMLQSKRHVQGLVRPVPSPPGHART
jgi:hypothetical protein